MKQLTKTGERNSLENKSDKVLGSSESIGDKVLSVSLVTHQCRSTPVWACDDIPESGFWIIAIQYWLKRTDYIIFILVADFATFRKYNVVVTFPLHCVPFVMKTSLTLFPEY